MRETITAQQSAFFTQNGYIEFEGPFDFAPLRSGFPEKEARDLWRHTPALEALLLRKLAPFAFALSGKNQLRLAFDQWIPQGFCWKKMASCKDLFSIQGLAVCCLIACNDYELPRPSTLGLLPLPSKRGHLLFVRPNLLLDWPKIEKVNAELYLAAFALPTSVYVQNTKDSHTNDLKSLGYGFGDPLKNEFHPLIQKG